MLLKTNESCDFNLSMNLQINYDLEYIEITVTLRNKRKHTALMKQFPAKDFSQALSYYKQQEEIFM